MLDFDFMDPPPRGALVKSMELLLALGALDVRTGDLTYPTGQWQILCGADFVPSSKQYVGEGIELHLKGMWGGMHSGCCCYPGSLNV